MFHFLILLFLLNRSSMLLVLLICLITCRSPVSSTVDITLPQFQYLANNLSFDQCIFLVQELFKIDSDIPEDLPCIELLLFWNSSPGEGLGETHQLVSALKSTTFIHLKPNYRLICS